MMQWFGTDWGAPICKLGEQIETPTGGSCAYCDVPIKQGDRGFRMPFEGDPLGLGYLDAHHQCLLRTVLPNNMVPRTHILRGGRALCRFVPGLPVTWPEGHTWVRETDWAEATCEVCRQSRGVGEGP